MSENRCPSCQRELPVADGAFCPYCGAALEKGDELPEPVRAALEAAGKKAPHADRSPAGVPELPAY